MPDISIPKLTVLPLTVRSKTPSSDILALCFPVWRSSINGGLGRGISFSIADSVGVGSQGSFRSILPNCAWL